MNNDQVLLKTWRWINNVVIGSNLCPFAQASIKQKLFQVKVCEAQNLDQAYRATLTYLQVLLEDEEDLESALLVFPHTLSSFDEYLDCVFAIEQALSELELEGLFQVASFHPQYQFEGVEEHDQANWSNRSPYPSIHFIREDSISKALLTVSLPDKIPERNVAYLRKLSVTQLKSLFNFE